VWRLLKKLKLKLPYKSSNTLPGIYTKECKSGYNKGTYTPMFTAAFFVIIKQWNSQDIPLLMSGLRKYGTYV
jgi:hypothetical protein